MYYSLKYRVIVIRSFNLHFSITDFKKMTMGPLLIIRTDSEAPDFMINNKESLSNRAHDLLQLIIDPKSSYYIEDDYLLSRLLNCISLAFNTSSEENSCPMIFDSWSCWNMTSPNTTQYTSCPDFDTFGFSSDRFSTKFCGEDGFWWIHPETNRLAMIFQLSIISSMSFVSQILVKLHDLLGSDRFYIS